MGMKCIQCGTDNLLKDRTTHGGRCKSCNHPFVFEPTTIADKKLAFTDAFFAKAIADISNQNTVFFTAKQLQYFLDRRLKTRAAGLTKGYLWILAYFFLSIFAFNFLAVIVTAILKIEQHSLFLVSFLYSFLYNGLWIWYFFRNSKSPDLSGESRRRAATNLQILGGIILILGIVSSLSSNSVRGYMTTMVLGLGSYWLGFVQKRRLPTIVDAFLVSDTRSQDWSQQWQQANGPLEKLLPAPELQALPASIDPEVSAYSFDRVIVCETDAIAQFLIANNVHFENNCAILSLSGYPKTIFATIMTMLRRNPDLKVYALHDASAAGIALIDQLRSSPDWLANQSATFFDLGISPRQVLASRHGFVHQSRDAAQAARRLSASDRQSLTAAEVTWLEEGRFVELESFSPQRLLQVVNQGIAQSNDPHTSGNLVLLDDSPTYGGGYVYVADNFG